MPASETSGSPSESPLPQDQDAGPQSPADRRNLFALVAYLPEPLAGFLDRMRAELEPDSLAPRAHVTILPPRPLADAVPWEHAWQELKLRVADHPSFAVVLGDVELFHSTHVVYLAIETGWDQLRSLHLGLNSGHLAFQDPFVFHPHVTLAQGLEPAEAERVVKVAGARWARFTSSKLFYINSLTFVQATSDSRWVDLATIDLPPGLVSA